MGSSLIGFSHFSATGVLGIHGFLCKIDIPHRRPYVDVTPGGSLYFSCSLTSPMFEGFGI